MDYFNQKQDDVEIQEQEQEVFISEPKVKKLSKREKLLKEMEEAKERAEEKIRLEREKRKKEQEKFERQLKLIEDKENKDLGILCREFWENDFSDIEKFKNDIKTILE